MSLDLALTLCATEIERRISALDRPAPELTSGHNALVRSLDGAAPIPGTTGTIGATSALDDLDSSPIVDAIVDGSDEISWHASSRLNDHGDTVGLATINDVRTLGDTVVGLMLLAAGATYPLHSHPPQELYLPISGNGRWRFGGSSDFRSLGPDELVYNRPDDEHSVIAGEQPLLAMYVLWP